MLMLQPANHVNGTAPRDVLLSAEGFRCALLWLTGASGAIVLIEPSPYEVTTLLSMAVFAITGVSLSPVFMPILFLLILTNIGYSISAAPIIDQPGIAIWLVTSWYLMLTALFFSMAVNENTSQRLDALMKGCIAGGVIASLAAIFGYFRLVPSLNDVFLLYDRARGTFKDPNVLGAFLIFPALLTLRHVIVGRFIHSLFHSLLFGLMAIAILLSFSRAAWGQLAYAGAVAVFLIFVTSQSPPLRLRIVLLTIGGVIVLACALAALLSLPSVSQLFEQRASFNQDYDVGAQGRFARHLLGAIMALDYPFGIGPLQFHKYFPEDTHNSFLNAFMSGGWLTGICYPAVVFSSLAFGLRAALTRTPWQQTTIVVFAAYFGTATESFIIDTDHWRHNFQLLGLLWGLIAVSRANAQAIRPEAGQPSTDVPSATGGIA